MSTKFSIVIEKDENGFYSYCPELKGCHSQGDTFEEVYLGIKEAIELYVETLEPDELQQIMNKEIFTGTIEFEFA